MHARSLGLTVLSLALAALPARAQYGYPYGYGGYGWGGFSAASGYGAEAAGLGNMAAGRGAYNLQTSEARAVNVNTNMQLNEYMYESIQHRDKALIAAQTKEAQDYTAALNATQDRLRNHPTPEDVYKGDALNIALTELSDPRYSMHVGQLASQIKIPGQMIANIPFNDAADAVTGCISKLTSAKPPKILQGPEFAADVAAYRKVSAELDKEAQAGDVKSATVKQFRNVIQGIADKLKADSGIDQSDKNIVEMHLKAMLGLSYMLDGPSLDIFLAGVGDMKEVGLDRLLSFMRAFNVRFGMATNPNQKQIYDTLYPLLVQLRQSMFGEGTGSLPMDAPPPRENDTRAQKFFAGMHIDDLHPNKDRTPPPPPPAGATP